MKSINALNSRNKYPPKPTIKINTTQHYYNKSSTLNENTYEPPSISSRYSLNTNNSGTSKRIKKQMIPFRNYSYIDSNNSNFNYNDNNYNSHHKNKKNPFRRYNSASTINRNYFYTNDEKSNIDYKEIVTNIISIMNKHLHSNINEYNLVYEIKNIIEQNHTLKYTKFDEYRDYCFSLMHKKNISSFENLKQYIYGLMNQREANDKYMKNLSRMLCQKPNSIHKPK